MCTTDKFYYFTKSTIIIQKVGLGEVTLVAPPEEAPPAEVVSQAPHS